MTVATVNMKPKLLNGIIFMSDKKMPALQAHFYQCHNIHPEIFVCSSMPAGRHLINIRETKINRESDCFVSVGNLKNYL